MTNKFEITYKTIAPEARDHDYVAVLELEANTPDEAYGKIRTDVSSRNPSNNPNDKLFLEIKENSKIQRIRML